METPHLKLSERLKNVSKFLPKGARFADIGSDHAYLACYACLEDESATCIAGEVNQGPYESAVNTIQKYGLQDRIQVKLGDGLEVINKDDEIKQVVIAGMGGGLITQILDEGKEKLDTVDLLILQPNIDARKIRRWLLKHRFYLINEEILEENGHIYEILIASRTGSSPYDESMKEKQLLFGPYLLREKSTVFYKKWQDELKQLERITEQMKNASNRNHQKWNQFMQELTWMKEEVQ